MAVVEIEGVSRGAYLSETGLRLGRRGKWFEVLLRVAQAPAGGGIRLTCETDGSARALQRRLRRLMEEHPAELWGAVVERVGNVVWVVPQEFLQMKQRRVTEAIRERIRRQRSS